MVFLGEDEYRDYVRNVFKMFDFDDENYVDLEIFKMLVAAVSTKPFADTTLANKLENAGKLGLDYEDFVLYFKKYFPIGKVATDLEFAFEKASEGGFITLESLKKANQENALGFTEQELRAMIREYDTDKDGNVTLDEIKQRFILDDVNVQFPLSAPPSLKPKD